MQRAFRYQLLPTPGQARVLESWLHRGRELYNAALEHRREAYRRQGTSIHLYDQTGALAEVREARPEFSSLPVVVLRGWLRRLDKAFKSFFRRCKTGGAPGFPRFKGRDRFDSIEIDDLGARTPIVAGGKRVAIPLLGKVKFRQHRTLEGKPKALRIKREGRRWYVVFLCADVPTKPLALTGREVGIDLGIRSLIATSNGELVSNPRALDAGQAALRVAQRRVARRKRGSKRRRQAVAFLAAKHRHVANIRRQHAIGAARSLVKRYDTIYREDLNVKGLASGMLAKQVNDAAWSTFTHWLDVKAEEAGRSVMCVNPRGTSQACSECGAVVPKGLGERTHRCPECGYVADRDVNAARVILGRGRRLRRGDLEVAQAPMTREASF